MSRALECEACVHKKHWLAGADKGNMLQNGVQDGLRQAMPGGRIWELEVALDAAKMARLTHEAMWGEAPGKSVWRAP